VIGPGAFGNYGGEVSIGNLAKCYGGSNVCVGDQAVAGTSYAIAIGKASRANGVNSVAIGMNANAGQDGSVAIGIDSSYSPATTTAANQIMLGSASHTVTTPGTVDFTKFSPAMIAALKTALGIT
jgi:autotransporter adhesin